MNALAKAEFTDEEIVARVSGGEAHLFEVLVNRYAGKIYGMALRMLGNPSDAEDALQEMFLSAYSKLDSFRGQSKFGTWLFSVALNAIYMKLRKRKLNAEENGDVDLFSDSTLSPAPANPEKEAVRNQALDDLRNAIVQLPDEQRIVLVARDIEELSAEQTAQALGITVAAVKSRLHRARYFLRNELSHHFS